MKPVALLAFVLVVLCVQGTRAWEEGDKAPAIKDWKTATEKHYGGKDCTCKGKDCSCCLGFKAVGKKYKACVKMEYDNTKIKVSLKFLGKTISSASFKESGDDYELCGKNTFKVCSKFIDVSRTANSFTAKTKIKVKGIGSKSAGPFTLRW